MGITGRVAELLVDGVQQTVTEAVLEHLGLVVHLVPAVRVLPNKPRLDEAVAAEHPQRQRTARGCQCDGAIRNVGDELLGAELFHHFGHR